MFRKCFYEKPSRKVSHMFENQYMKLKFYKIFFIFTKNDFKRIFTN